MFTRQMVKKVVDAINAIILESTYIDPTNQPEAVQKIVNDIQNLKTPLLQLKRFVKKDPDFKNKLNDEGMPPRIIEEELELAIRHDLDAAIRSLGLSGENYLSDLADIEFEIYNKIEDRDGRLMTFNHLGERYESYTRFFSEEREGRFEESAFGKRYTPQEAHVTIHIASFVNSMEEALKFAQHDGGRHLCNLLHTYIEWAYDPGTHVHYDIDIVKSHGSLRGIADKNGKTILDWTKSFRKKTDNESRELLRAFESAIRKGIYRDEETGELKKITSLDPANSENIKLEGAFKPIKEKGGPINNLDLATDKKSEDM